MSNSQEQIAASIGVPLEAVAAAGHVRGRPYLDAVTLLASADPQADLQAGRADVASGEGPSARSLAATLLLVLPPSDVLLARREQRVAIAAAVDRLDLVQHLLRGGDAAPSLLTPGLLPPLGTLPSATPGRLAGDLALTVATDVPPLVSQRVIALLGAQGLRVTVTALAAGAARRAAGARLLLWIPEVAEPELALRELAALAGSSAAHASELDACARLADPDRRRARLHRVEAALRDDHVLVPLASAPVSFRSRHGVHGLTVDLAAALRLEDVWTEP